MEITKSKLALMKFNASGLIPIELIVATTILLILSGIAVPMASVTIKREREAPAPTGTLVDA